MISKAIGGLKLNFKDSFTSREEQTGAKGSVLWQEEYDVTFLEDFRMTSNEVVPVHSRQNLGADLWVYTPLIEYDRIRCLVLLLEQVFEHIRTKPFKFYRDVYICKWYVKVEDKHWLFPLKFLSWLMTVHECWLDIIRDRIILLMSANFKKNPFTQI